MTERILAWLQSHRRRAGLLARCTDRLFEPNCVLCGERGDLGAALDLCSWCMAVLPWRPRDEREPHLWAPFHYADPVDEQIKQLKFEADLAVARVLGALLAAFRGLEPLRVAALVPVPLHRSRRAERGFDQALRIAQEAARWLALPVRADLLVRVRPTASQSGLGARARRVNVTGAFEVRRAGARVLMPARSCVALVDDVLTTGATLAAAAQALRAVDLQVAEVWTLARAGYVEDISDRRAAA